MSRRRRSTYRPREWSTAAAVCFVISLTALAVIIDTALLLGTRYPAW
ncbi:hypothetical protein [Humibacter ginsenosidimutans]|nr:hypothetical protein [Humibacter ginsenosidimutans]